MSEDNKTSKIKNVGHRTGRTLKELISGRVFVSGSIQKYLPYIFFLFVLAVVYIGYRYKIESTVLQNGKLKREVKVLYSEYVTKSIELMRISKRSEIIKKIDSRDISVREPEHPPIRVKAE